MRKVIYTDFVTTESLISELLGKTEVKKAVTRNNLYKFWGKVVGKKFSEKSKPFSMMSGGIMVIACENSVVAQELMLKKTQLIVKLKPYLESLKMNVKDFKFDPKKWEKITEE